MGDGLPVEQRLTYDDVNEFFWSGASLQWTPFVHDGARCITTALRVAPKTHMEARRGGWLRCTQRGDRVLLAGRCRLFATGRTFLPD